MDRRSILDGVARGPGATRATAFVATRQITPQGRGLLCGPIDECVDFSQPMARSRGSFPDFNQPEICSGVHPSASRWWIPTRSATPSTALVPQRKVGFPIPNPRLLLGFQGTKTARREGISNPFSDAGGCTSPQNSEALEHGQKRGELP
jgi:hypothetical protein